MTVKELIEELMGYDGDLPVAVRYSNEDRVRVSEVTGAGEDRLDDGNKKCVSIDYF